ncbi:helix-turn-helix domain-containing protein [Haladaptatus sp.]|uniref:helix-turn-helix domain-containing protein n=1 Tax=Haladaptatus sp. TaxID=1973141 RepID=UPI003C371637
MVSVTRLNIGTPLPLDEDELTPAEKGVLNLLGEGRCTPAYVASELAIESGTARSLLDGFREVDIVQKPYRGLYELTLEEPADDGKYRTTETVFVDVPFEDDQFRPTERGILNLLSRGRATPAYLAQELDVTQECVKNRLRDITRLGLVRRVHRGLYALDEE